LGGDWELAYIEDKMIDVGIALGWIQNELSFQDPLSLASGYEWSPTSRRSIYLFFDYWLNDWLLFLRRNPSITRRSVRKQETGNRKLVAPHLIRTDFCQWFSYVMFTAHVTHCPWLPVGSDPSAVNTGNALLSSSSACLIFLPPV
jgi:plasmid stabilization system protein ParE